MHRPRQSVITSTSNASPPWPRYLVIRSPSFPDGQYISLIDVNETAAKGKANAKEQDEDSLEFSLSLPTRPSTKDSQVRSSRPAHLDLALHSTLSINDDDEEKDPLTPTAAKPNPSKPVKKSRPKSATYRVDMTPSLSRDSATSSTSEQSASSAVTDTSLTSQDPLSTSTPPPPTQREVDTSTASFCVQPSLPPALVARMTPTGFGKRVFGKLRSLVVEEGKTWSCIWEKPSESNDNTKSDTDDEEVIMYFEEDPPS